jgi:hypothetical protein
LFDTLNIFKSQPSLKKHRKNIPKNNPKNKTSSKYAKYDSNKNAQKQKGKTNPFLFDTLNISRV